jgi:hypothetical protein
VAPNLAERLTWRPPGEKVKPRCRDGIGQLSAGGVIGEVALDEGGLGEVETEGRASIRIVVRSREDLHSRIRDAAT